MLVATDGSHGWGVGSNGVLRKGKAERLFKEQRLPKNGGRTEVGIQGGHGNVCWK